MRRADDAHVDRVIETVRLYISHREAAEFVVTDKPDRKERSQKACDALLEAATIRYAVEHTSLDSYKDHRQDTHRFDTAIQALNGKFVDALPYDLWIAIPAQAIQKGKREKWSSIGARIEQYVASGAAGTLPLDESRRIGLDGIPFPLLVRREAASPGSLLLMRETPRDIRTQRVQVIRELLAKKASKMPPYIEAGWRTMLVIESDDFALINRNDFVDEFREATAEGDHHAFADVVLIQTTAAGTGSRPSCVTPLKVRGELRDEAEPCWPDEPGWPYPHLFR